MRLAIFGGTGQTGRLLLARALEEGHDVRALARRPEALEDLRHERLTVVAGDVRQADRVEEVLSGCEAALSTLGPVKDSGNDLLSTAARTIVAGAREQEVRRLVWLTGAGVRDERDEPKLVDRLFVTALKLLQRRLLEDSIAAVETIRASDLDWTVVRAPRLVDGQAETNPRVGMVGSDSGTKVARATVAALMLDEAVSPTRVREMPVVSAR